jgi:hypothetical protein
VRGWDREAEAAGFELLLTTDKNMRYQQNSTGRKNAFVVIGNQQWPTLRRYVDRVVVAVNAATPGSFAEVDIPSSKAPPPVFLCGAKRRMKFLERPVISNSFRSGDPPLIIMESGKRDNVNRKRGCSKRVCPQTMNLIISFVWSRRYCCCGR